MQERCRYEGTSRQTRTSTPNSAFSERAGTVLVLVLKLWQKENFLHLMRGDTRRVSRYAAQSTSDSN